MESDDSDYLPHALVDLDTKKANEAMAHSYAHLYGLPVTMFRFFTVYGPWGRPDMALFKFTRAILEGQPIDIYNHGEEIERALQRVFDEAVAKKAPMIEIIPGKGTGQLKKHVLRFLERKDIKPLYHRVEKDSKNFGRLFVHFRWR